MATTGDRAAAVRAGPALRVIEGGLADDEPARDRALRETEFRFHAREQTPVGVRRFAGTTEVRFDGAGFILSRQIAGGPPEILIGNDTMTAMELWRWFLDRRN